MKAEGVIIIVIDKPKILVLTGEMTEGEAGLW